MKNILCPTDFSSTAQSAVSYAAKLAQKHGGRVHLFHAALLADVTPEEFLFGAGLTVEQFRILMEKECQEVRDVFKVPCFAEPVASGASLATHISDSAHPFDLIVMGTNGEDTWLQKITGSNTYKAIRQARTPILIIPDGFMYSAIHRVAYAYDLWRNTEVPFQQVAKLTHDLKADLTIVQVMEAFSMDADREIKGQYEIVKDSFEPYAKVSLKVLYNDSIPDALHGFMDKGNADLLVLQYKEGNIARIILPGIVRQLSRQASYPVFVFH